MTLVGFLRGESMNVYTRPDRVKHSPPHRAPPSHLCSPESMTRDEITQQVIAARLAKGLTWQHLAEAVDRPVVWTTAALLGQHPIPPAAAATVLVALLGLDPAAEAGARRGPVPRRPADRVPTDPTIYRFYEALRSTARRLEGADPRAVRRRHHERHQLQPDLEKTPAPGGADRVVVTFDGKFLPYDWPAD